MQLRQLNHLIALADHGSFGRAAEAVHLSQPALSRSIESLEESLQARLIDRGYGRVRMTDAGELVLARARSLLADASHIQRDVQMLQGLVIGTLRVGLGPFASAMLGQPALVQMIKRHPRLALQVEVADASTLSERLDRQQLDLFVADTRDLKRQPGLQFKRLPNVPVGFFVRKRHPLLGQKTLGLDQLMDYPVGSPDLPQRVAQNFERQATRTDRPVFSVVSNDMSTLRHLALAVDAVILAPDAPAFLHGTESLVRLVVPALDEMLTHYSIVSQVNRTLSPAARAFSALIHEIMSQGKVGEQALSV